MRVPAAILIAACTLAAGCASLTGRGRDRDREARPAIRERDADRDDRPWWMDGTANGGRTPTGGSLARTEREGIIAGELVDSSEGRRLKGKTFIIVRPADEVAPASGSGNVGVETDDDGYFFMPGLVPGKTYILSAVREVDGRRIAAEAQVKPPAGNIRMELAEGKVSSVTPPSPPPPGMGPFERSNNDPATIRAPVPADPPVGADRDWDPPPVPSDSGLPRIEPPPSLRRENIAGTPSLPPTAAIRPPPPAAGAVPPPPPAVAPPGTGAPMSRAPGQRIPNFLVTDVFQSDWEFRYAAGRLILVEFWGTTCGPCAQAVPAMKRLQTDYGSSGLEIVAVACEADASLASRVRLADDFARRKELNYKVYVERDGRVGEVQRLFNVQWVPTLVLLDRQGSVLWRGGASAAEMNQLEEIVRDYLTRR